MFKKENELIYNRILASLVRLAQFGKAEQREKLLQAIKPHLKKTNKMLSEIILFVYAMDLQKLKAGLENIATASPNDYEGQKAYSSGGHATPVTNRYHMARKIVAIWNEEDPSTKAKLLIAFDFYSGNDRYGVAIQTIKKQLQELTKAFPSKDTRQVVDFMDWYEQEVVKLGKKAPNQAKETDLGKFVRKTFKTNGQT